MNAYEYLQNEACEDGIDIIEKDFSKNIKGLYCDGTIAINENIETTTEKACVLAEELGHHYTTVGNIINLSDVQNRKQERQARLNGYNRMIGLTGLIRAFEHGCKNRYETAEFLEVTEEYLQECIDCYRDKYGVGTTIGNYYIMFIPNLMVGKIDFSM
ncbi:MAG: ImmA/IrrE family metallo-endopeptidase [Lachnospiraceae bacterium]